MNDAGLQSSWRSRLPQRLSAHFLRKMPRTSQRTDPTLPIWPRGDRSRRKPLFSVGDIGEHGEAERHDSEAEHGRTRRMEQKPTCRNQGVANGPSGRHGPYRGWQSERRKEIGSLATGSKKSTRAGERVWAEAGGVRPAAVRAVSVGLPRYRETS